MPGKQTALSADCWPDRLIADVPSFYLYAANNPSEGTIAKRRASATLVSYLTPAVAQAGLYRGLSELKASLERWRNPDHDDDAAQRTTLAQTVQAQLPPSTWRQPNQHGPLPIKRWSMGCGRNCSNSNTR